MPSLRPPTHALGSSPAEASATKPIRPWRQGARSLLRARGCCASELTLPWERKGPCLLVCSGGRRQRASGFSPAQGLPAVGTAVGGRAASAPSSPLSPALIFPAIAPPQKRKLLTLRHLDTSRTSGLGLGQIPGPCLLALSGLPRTLPWIPCALSLGERWVLVRNVVPAVPSASPRASPLTGVGSALPRFPQSPVGAGASSSPASCSGQRVTLHC